MAERPLRITTLRTMAGPIPPRRSPLLSDLPAAPTRLNTAAAGGRGTLNVTIPEQLGQNVADRAIAHNVTGGIGVPRALESRRCASAVVSVQGSCQARWIDDPAALRRLCMDEKTRRVAPGKSCSMHAGVSDLGAAHVRKGNEPNVKYILNPSLNFDGCWHSIYKINSCPGSRN